MAKRKTDWDEDKLKKWIQEGRGQGEGKEYKPWLTVTDFSSRGRCSRLKGIKTGGFIILWRILRHGTFTF